jgi:hypothetical protein
MVAGATAAGKRLAHHGRAAATGRLVGVQARPYLPPHRTAPGGAVMNQSVDRAEANRLYWDTEESVADIARRLDMSRRALYDAIEPLPSGAACEACGAPLSFENRSARVAGEATCPVCTAHAGATDADLPPQAADTDEEDRLAVLGSAAIAGAALGALLTLMVVPRR